MALPYKVRIDRLLTPHERSVFKKLASPQRIQDFLDSLPINFELHGETYMSPRRVLTAGEAHCFEGALLAAAALAYHGRRPLLMDIQTSRTDDDHVVALFREFGYWGAISKTNHAILRYRDPVYRSVRELALSYFNEYIDDGRHKSMRAYSAPFDLSRYHPKIWVTAGEDLDSLVASLDSSRHFPIAPKKILTRLRPAAKIELDILDIVEWKEPRGYNKEVR